MGLRFGFVLNNLNYEKDPAEFKKVFDLFYKNVFSKSSESEKPVLVSLIVNELRRWQNAPYLSGVMPNADVILAMMDSLMPFTMDMWDVYKKNPENIHALQVCLQLFAMNYNPDDIPVEVPEKLSKIADKFLGVLRTRINENIDRNELEFIAEMTRDSAVFMTKFKNPWAPLKSLLLIVRELKSSPVTSDLRHWEGEDGDEMPDVKYCWIPRTISNLVKDNYWPEKTKDKKLTNLRADFAKFCLSRLKTRDGIEKTEGFVDCDFYEVDPGWRYAYIRALRNLRINPEGKGHLILEFCRKNDPSEKVRDAANPAYKELRHNDGIPEDMSPQIAILGAFWWIKRQSFINTKGIDQLDEKGAQKNYKKEVGYVKEKELKLI
jgi:hypothetical protein